MKKQLSDIIPLYRNNSIVSSMLGAFGGSLKETRVTAVIGYLISMSPHQFCKFFKIEIPTNISLETYHGDKNEGRSDILIKTLRGNVVIEAKVDATNPYEQSKRYPGYHHILLSAHKASSKEKKQTKVTYCLWSEFAKILIELSRGSNYEVKYLSKELLKYMEEHSMIRKKDTLEVYSREINDESSLNLFLKAHIYGCDYKRSNKINEAKYFAPHFAKHIAKQHTGISTGISYIAFIEHIEASETWNEFMQQVKDIRGRVWINKNKKYIDSIRKEKKWQWGKVKKKRNFLFLSEPRLAFNPAVNKDNLQKGKGFLSKQTYSFDDLFKARSERIW